MNGDDSFALVPRPSNAIVEAAPGSERILSGMVADTLALMKRDQFAPSATKFRIGAQELCEPDYLQVIAWAEQLSLTPSEVLHRLIEGLSRKGDETQIVNGKFIKLNWDAGLLPSAEFRISFTLDLVALTFAPSEQIADVSLEELDLVPAATELPSGYDKSARVLQISTAALPKLKRLNCSSIGLKNLAMAPAPTLERLDCSWNDFSTLDLRSFPNLKELVCGGSGFLNYLDLRHVPKLLELNCADSLIKELDLRSVPKLQKLNCSDNNLNELVLPDLPELVELDCENSIWDKERGLGCHLEKLDLRGVPNLRRLNCYCNALKEIDLGCTNQLMDLNCDDNLLTRLDVSCTPMLETLKCDSRHHDSLWIRTLNIGPLHHLKKLHHDPRTQLIQRPDQHF